ncbi:MAG: tRNA pseudouridine(55) synthase TruB [Candidatus Nanopelagicales bacterium]
MNGLLLVDKPAGPSSHQVVAGVRRTLACRKVGHAGTLDPAASGLLVLGVGPGTRLLTFLVGLDKDYRATIRLGQATDTDDAAGTVVSSVGCPVDADVEEAVSRLRGPLLQRPSSVSAIKVDGKRAYARVRSGESPDLPARPVTVDRFDVLSRRSETVDGVSVVDLDVVVSVSSGTYVRALARDLGDMLGVGGHLTALRRTRVGPFDVRDAVVDVTVDTPLLDLGAAAGMVLPTVTLDEVDARAVGNGARLPCVGADTPTALMDPTGRLVAVSVCRDGRWKHLFVVPSATLGAA